MAFRKSLYNPLGITLALSLLTGCGNGGSATAASSAEAALPADQAIAPVSAPLSGAGVKGPLAYASINVYNLDTSLPGFYNPEAPLVTTTTDASGHFSALQGLTITRPVVMVIDGSNAIDMSTTMAPVVTKLINIVTPEMLASMKPVYATPLTSMAFYMARDRAGANAADMKVLGALMGSAESIRIAFGLGMPADANILADAPLLEDSATDATSQARVAQHRAALEALATVAHEMAQLSVATGEAVTADQIVERLALDLSSDGVVDNAANGVPVGGINISLLARDPASLVVANTSIAMSDMTTLLNRDAEVGASSVTLDAPISFILAPIQVNSPVTDTVPESGMDDGEPAPGSEPPIDNSAPPTDETGGTPPTESPDVDTPPVDPNSSIPALFPRDGAKGVITSEVISALFQGSTYKFDVVSEFTVSTNGSAVDGAIGRDGEKVTFTPSVALAKQTTYTAHLLASGVKTGTSESITIDQTWEFTTVNNTSSEIVLYNDFNDLPTGIYSESDIRRTWNVIGAVVGARQNRFSIVDSSDKGRGKVLRIKYEGNRRGVEDGGVQWKSDIGKHDELYVSFWVKFENNFEFVIGGKVPGLRGGRPLGKVKPNGRDRFSGRMMWREKGKVVQYVYHPDQPAQAGQEMDWNLGGQRYFKPGKWHRLETRIKLNTPGKRNGIIQSWFDGELALDRRNIRFRDISSLKIDIFDFSSFFGGASDKWKTKKQEYAYYDDIVVSTKPIAH